MSHQSNNSAPLYLDKSEQANLGKYIRGCEIDSLQAQHYEKMYTECSRDLGMRPSLLSTTISYVMAIAVGYIIGVNR